jgi:hypothetical protein
MLNILIPTKFYGKREKKIKTKPIRLRVKLTERKLRLILG